MTIQSNRYKRVINTSSTMKDSGFKILGERSVRGRAIEMPSGKVYLLPAGVYPGVRVHHTNDGLVKTLSLLSTRGKNVSGVTRSFYTEEEFKFAIIECVENESSIRDEEAGNTEDSTLPWNNNVCCRLHQSRFTQPFEGKEELITWLGNMFEKSNLPIWATDPRRNCNVTAGARKYFQRLMTGLISEYDTPTNLSKNIGYSNQSISNLRYNGDGSVELLDAVRNIGSDLIDLTEFNKHVVVLKVDGSKISEHASSEMYDFAIEFQRVRVLMGFSITTASDIMGCPSQYISKYEAGSLLPTIISMSTFISETMHLNVSLKTLHEAYTRAYAKRHGSVPIVYPATTVAITGFSEEDYENIVIYVGDTL